MKASAEIFHPTLWIAEVPLVLASGSRTRADLLASAGLDARIVKPLVDEREIEAKWIDSSPCELARRLAAAKASDVADRHSGCIIIGADQVLELDGEIFHKPADLDDARSHLNRLQGRIHALHSAVAIVGDRISEVFHETARLTMRVLDARAIEAYLTLVSEARVITSVGGYQLEGLGIHLFERVEGEHSTVLGLPMIPLLAKLRALRLLSIG